MPNCAVLASKAILPRRLLSVQTAVAAGGWQIVKRSGGGARHTLPSWELELDLSLAVCPCTAPGRKMRDK